MVQHLDVGTQKAEKLDFGGQIAENDLLVQRRSATKVEQSSRKRLSETLLSRGMR
jgi:hypothetical protein